MKESGTDWAECSRKVVSGRRVTDTIRSLVNAQDLQLECAKVLHEILLLPVLTYGSETILWKEKSRIRLYRWTISEACLVLGGWVES